MEFHETESLESFNKTQHWLPKNTVEIDQHTLFFLTEKICRDKQCRYPQLALRILLHMITGMDSEGRIYICARQTAKEMDVNYDTVTKCLKYLREIEAIRIER